jgi:Protein of unknown function (DUF2688)
MAVVGFQRQFARMEATMTTTKFTLVKSNCKRCGCVVLTGNRSLLGADGLKAELGGICSRCVTPAEEARILEGQATTILEAIANA